LKLTFWKNAFVQQLSPRISQERPGEKGNMPIIGHTLSSTYVMRLYRCLRLEVFNKKDKTISGSAFLQGHQFKHSL
jgi:hypothetical protein